MISTNIFVQIDEYIEDYDPIDFFMWPDEDDMLPGDDIRIAVEHLRKAKVPEKHWPTLERIHEQGIEMATIVAIAKHTTLYTEEEKKDIVVYISYDVPYQIAFFWRNEL
jgi:hypothetical protein